MWQQPIVVNGYRTFVRFHGQVALHTANSREASLARIRQLPAGAGVRVFAGGPDPDALRFAMFSEAGAGLSMQ